MHKVLIADDEKKVGMLLMGIDSNWQGVVKGIVLVAAVGIDCMQHKVRKVKAKAA